MNYEASQKRGSSKSRTMRGDIHRSNDGTNLCAMRKTNRPSGVFKTENSYQKMINPQLYERIPKAVLAALVVDLILIRSEENFSIINKSIIEEWQVLYNNGIVPQKPPKI